MTPETFLVDDAVLDLFARRDHRGLRQERRLGANRVLLWPPWVVYLIFFRRRSSCSQVSGQIGQFV